MNRERTDIPQRLLDEAEAVGPSVLAALIASYPTDAEHERNERRKRVARQKQLSLDIETKAA